MHTTSKSQRWWTTPVLEMHSGETVGFNERLRQIILRMEKELTVGGEPRAVAGIERGMTAHWHEYNVLNWNFPECRTLGRIALEGARQFLSLIGDPDDPSFTILGIACWANVLRYGESMNIHHHDQAFMNAHYIVCGEDGGGETLYYRPGFIERSQGERQGETRNPWDADWRVSTPPKIGRIMFFPSYVRHEVRPYLGANERISVAFDFYVQLQEPLIHFGGKRWFVPDEVRGA